MKKEEKKDKEDVKKGVKEPSKKIYSVSLKTNGKLYKSNGEDLKEIFMSLKPSQFLTESYIIVESGELKFERYLNLTQTKRVFRSVEYLEAFLTNIYF